jgi:hypothetical protein
MSQRIKVDHISESTIARIAGNLMSGYVEVDDWRRAEVVQRAVKQAREIAAEVQRTRPTAPPEDREP